jgi:hypothetical protein
VLYTSEAGSKGVQPLHVLLVNAQVASRGTLEASLIARGVVSNGFNIRNDAESGTEGLGDASNVVLVVRQATLVVQNASLFVRAGIAFAGTCGGFRDSAFTVAEGVMIPAKHVCPAERS